MVNKSFPGDQSPVYINNIGSSDPFNDLLHARGILTAGLSERDKGLLFDSAFHRYNKTEEHKLKNVSASLAHDEAMKQAEEGMSADAKKVHLGYLAISNELFYLNEQTENT